jgi:hypothetical protein
MHRHALHDLLQTTREYRREVRWKEFVVCYSKRQKKSGSELIFRLRRDPYETEFECNATGPCFEPEALTSIVLRHRVG